MRGRLALGAVVAVFLLSAIPAGPKEPGIYVQWMFSYDLGLIKRGLLGTIVLHGLWPAAPIAVSQLFRLSGALSLVSVALFGALAARSNPSQLLSAALLLATPIGVVYYVANPHYMEVALLVLLGACLNVLRSKPRQWVALVVVSLCSLASALVHEASLLSTVPVMLAGHCLVYAPTHRRALGAVVVVYSTCVALILAIGGGKGAEAAQLVMSRAAPGFPVDLHYTRVLDRSIFENIRFTFGEYSRPHNGSRVILAMIPVAPALLLLSRGLLSVYGRPLGRALVAVGLLPLALCLIADDVYRWYVLAVVGLASLALLEPPAQPETAARVELRVVALAAAFLPFPFFAGDTPNPLFPVLARVAHAVVP